jgi:UDP-glucose 4-epimerase
MARAVDLGDYFRIPADTRDLNYDKFFVDGEQSVTVATDYTSHNTKRLSISEVKETLLKLDLIKGAIGE